MIFTPTGPGLVTSTRHAHWACAGDELRAPGLLLLLPAALTVRGSVRGTSFPSTVFPVSHVWSLNGFVLFHSECLILSAIYFPDRISPRSHLPGSLLFWFEFEKSKSLPSPVCLSVCLPFGVECSTRSSPPRLAPSRRRLGAWRFRHCHFQDVLHFPFIFLPGPGLLAESPRVAGPHICPGSLQPLLFPSCHSPSQAGHSAASAQPEPLAIAACIHFGGTLWM